MSEHAIQLSVILIEELFGELPSRVFFVLAFHGRLPFVGLVHHAQLSATQVKHSLSILIQQHLVLWYDPDNTGRAFYEADLPKAYALARSGKYIQIINDRTGYFPSDVVSSVILLGHVRVGDLTQTYFPPGGEGPLRELTASDQRLASDASHLDKPNDGSDEAIHTVDGLHTTISNLLVAGLLRPLHESHLRPAADNVAEAEHIVPRDSSIKSKKEEQVTWEMAVKQKLEDWRYGSNAEAKTNPLQQKGSKRPLEDSDNTPDGKRTKLIESRSDGLNALNGGSRSTQSGWLDNDLVVRVNHEKFAIIMRNQQLAALVDDSIGITTAKVYAELLCIAEPQLRKCKTEIDTSEGDDDEADWANLPQVSTKELGHLLQDLPDLSEALGYVDPSKISLKRLDHPKRTRRRRASLNQEFDEAEVEGPASSDENEEGMSVTSNSDIAESDSESRSSESDADDSSNKRKYKTPDTTPDSTPKTNGT
ncbi:MAG: hypothetical protein Q9181_005377, partial [Wetmoreana brouardii]